MNDALDAAWDSLDEAWGDDDWLERSKRKQDAARASVEADDLTAEPSKGDELAAFATGGANALGLGLADKAAGLANALSPAGVTKGLETAYREGRDEVRADHEAASAGKLGDAYSTGALSGDVINSIMGLAGVGKNVAAEVASTGKITPSLGVFKPFADRMGPRLSAASKDLQREAVGGVQTKRLDNAWRAIKTLAGRGGEVDDAMIKSADTILPEWMAPLTDAAHPPPGPVVSGLDIVKRPPPIPTPKPRPPRAPKAKPAEAAPPEATKAPVADDLDEVAQVRAPAAEAPAAAPAASSGMDPNASSGILKNPMAMPGEPDFGVYATNGEIEAFVRNMELGDMVSMSKKLPLAPPPNAPMSSAEMKKAVVEAAQAGESLKETAKRLGVNQGDISAWFKSAQIGF